MVMEDPDYYAMQETQTIGIFEPGKNIERAVDWDRLFHVLVLTGAAFAFTIALSLIMIIPLFLVGAISINIVTLEIEMAPWAFLVITLSELGFIIPPLRYIRKQDFGLDAIGLKVESPGREVLFGLGIGAIMLASNIAITYIVYELVGYSGEQTDIIYAQTIPELMTWIIVMFVVVGLSEELLFRGFLQRRMDIYFRDRKKHYKLISLMLTSFIFAAIHLELYGMPARFVLGIFLGWLAQKRDYSIVGPTVAHGVNNSVVVILTFLGI
ncbi:MAG: type II CAAX endopeptidase family protein [Candidatus Thorarchaeota archaeon]